MPSVTVTTRNKSYFAGPDLEPWQIRVNRTKNIIFQIDLLTRDVLCARSQLSGNDFRIDLNEVNLAELTHATPSDPLFAMKQKVSGEVRLDEHGNVVCLELSGNNERVSFEDGHSWFGLGRERQIYTYEKLTPDGFVEQEKVTTQSSNEWLYSWNSVR